MSVERPWIVAENEAQVECSISRDDVVVEIGIDSRAG